MLTWAPAALGRPKSQCSRGDGRPRPSEIPMLTWGTAALSRPLTGTRDPSREAAVRTEPTP